jgi:hypothetical protein
VGVVHPESPGHTGPTGAYHRSDRCRPQLGFCSGEHLGESLLSRVAVILSLGQFGAR